MNTDVIVTGCLITIVTSFSVTNTREESGGGEKGGRCESFDVHGLFEVSVNKGEKESEEEVLVTESFVHFQSHFVGGHVTLKEFTVDNHGGEIIDVEITSFETESESFDNLGHGFVVLTLMESFGGN